ncbi:ATP-binding cassette domain-containing protein [Flintibacter sp.]|uniref:ATP-binding cassette domain-containing protein n=1 Tax=Flintibacter sp. TaxID=1918624 RepID=UPI003A2A8FDD
MESIIEVQDVTKTFKGTTVLHQINVSFEKGKIHGIIGRNGSGKTVLIKTICGLIHPDQGRVVVDGKVIGKDVDFPESIGAIIEAPGFLPTVSAYRNLSYLASLRRRIGRDEIRAAISFVGLDPDDKKAVGKYSLGMKQRLGLAQAIMEDPSILLLDEPMNGLDNSGVCEMRNYLLQLRKREKTILLVSHSLEDINTLCDSVYEMDHGVLTEKKHIPSGNLDRTLEDQL